MTATLSAPAPVTSTLAYYDQWLLEAAARETLAARAYRAAPSAEAAHTLKLMSDELRYVEERIKALAWAGVCIPIP